MPWTSRSPVPQAPAVPLRRTPAVLLLAAGVSSLGLGGCAHHTRHAAAPAPAVTPTPTPTRRPAPPARPRPLTFLAGLPVHGPQPVLAVKIDNTHGARPQTGLDSADVVYLEQVEGGLTRLMAIFSSRLPSRVGPVRSVRESDLELLREYGRVALSFSGANAGVLATVRRSPVVEDSPDTAEAFFSRSGDRPAPYNLYLDAASLLRTRHGAYARDIGLRFGALTRWSAGTPAASSGVAFPMADVGWRYDPRARLWRIWMDGAPNALTDGAVASASNVVVQYVDLRGSGYVDVAGNATPFTVTVGSGTAVVFRDGRRLTGTWFRRRPQDGTRFIAARRDIPLRPGTTWILLVPRGTPLRAS